MSSNNDFLNRIANQGTLSVTIPTGKTESGTFSSNGMNAIAIDTPANFTTSDITFKAVGVDGLTANATKVIYSPDDSSSIYTISGAVANARYYLDARIFAGTNTFKIITATAQTTASIISFLQIPLLYA